MNIVEVGVRHVTFTIPSTVNDLAEICTCLDLHERGYVFTPDAQTPGRYTITCPKTTCAGPVSGKLDTPPTASHGWLWWVHALTALLVLGASVAMLANSVLPSTLEWV